MSGRSITGTARQRIGVALSRDLLAALSSRPPSGFGYNERATRQRLSLARSGNDDAALSSQTQAAPSSRFRIYSLFGDTVPLTSARGSTEDIGHSPMSTAGDDSPDENATSAGLIEALTDPVRRRSWLLAKALETQPLDQALELARAAEAFVTGSPTLEAGETAIPPRSDKRIDPTSARDTKPLKKRESLALAPEQHEHLLDRLAQGARNAEVASEFGLSIRQVQGVRMGSAREITRRRDRVRDER